ncbi:MAG TPA: cytochrome c [Gallionellaceae bacterium]|nr:cytochrome c [Gallionellaceae bacterium]
MKKLVMAATLSTSLLALAAQAAEPLAFQGVMKELGKHMQTVAGAIALEDWETVEKTAPLIAAHPQPPAEEKARIIGFMGANMGKFKSFDMQAHEAAHKMEHAAHEQDGQQVIDAYREVQSACLGCHQNFRKPFVEHFYGKK